MNIIARLILVISLNPRFGIHPSLNAYVDSGAHANYKVWPDAKSFFHCQLTPISRCDYISDTNMVRFLT